MNVVSRFGPENFSPRGPCGQNVCEIRDKNVTEWNDYLFAVFLSSKDNGPVILGLANLAGSQIVPYPEVFAGALLVTAPTLIVYIVLRRWFVGGLMAGAVKS